VPSNSVLTANHVLCLYKGTSPFEAAAVYAPYMPSNTGGVEERSSMENLPKSVEPQLRLAA